MNKADLVESVARQMGSSKAEAERAVVAVTDAVEAQRVAQRLVASISGPHSNAVTAAHWIGALVDV